MKKKTPTQKYIDQAINKAKEELAGNHMSHCSIAMNVNVGDAIQLVAEGLVENAKALGLLASSIKDQHITGIYITSKEITPNN